MSIIKSFSVGDGDMFYINHGSDSFTIIDCCLNSETKQEILREIYDLKSRNGIHRFISTHPDEDHIQGLVDLDNKISICNFYCVENSTTKEDESDNFRRYRQLYESDRSYYIFKNCRRRWLNESNEERGQAGIEILWPDTTNEEYKTALKNAANGDSPNNISPIIQYSLNRSVTALWMGDLETEFMEEIRDDVQLAKIDLLFAPHHGRDSGRIPGKMLETLDPEIIVVGEAPSKHLNYYAGYKTITQNSAGDIIFDCLDNKIRIFTTNDYKVDFLSQEYGCHRSGLNYVGTLNL